MISPRSIGLVHCLPRPLQPRAAAEPQPAPLGPGLPCLGEEQRHEGLLGLAIKGRWAIEKLVGGIPTPLKNMKVNWDDYNQYMGKYKMFQTTNQKKNEVAISQL